MRNVGHIRIRLALVLMAVAFAIGSLFGPAVAEAAKVAEVLITNTADQPVPVVHAPTVVLASGSTSVAANYGSALLVSDLDVSAYRTLRILARVNNALCTDQNVAIFVDGYISPASPGDLPDCGQPSILFDTPGTKLTVNWLNKDPTNAADVTFEVVGRN